MVTYLENDHDHESTLPVALVRKMLAKVSGTPASSDMGHIAIRAAEVFTDVHDGRIAVMAHDKSSNLHLVNESDICGCHHGLAADKKDKHGWTKLDLMTSDSIQEICTNCVSSALNDKWKQAYELQGVSQNVTAHGDAYEPEMPEDEGEEDVEDEGVEESDGIYVPKLGSFKEFLGTLKYPQCDDPPGWLPGQPFRRPTHSGLYYYLCTVQSDDNKVGTYIWNPNAPRQMKIRIKPETLLKCTKESDE